MPDTLAPPSIPTAPVTPAVLDGLRAIVGERGLILDDQGKEPFVRDWRGTLVGTAAVVVRPANTEEVSKVVKLCFEHGIAIVPQGGNTGLMGGATPYPTHSGIVLSLGRMNKVIEVDPVGYSMTVEAGCILQTLQETAASHDRFFPLSLGAQGSCLIGGNLSTNAGGVQVLRYGNARNLVMGLEVVLPNGDVWNGLRSLKKDNTGYDLKHLFMGAEGTLGIITKAVLKLWPAPKDVATAWLAVRDPQAAIEILSEAHAASDDNVGSCELMSRAGTDVVLRHIPGVQDPLKADTNWFLLLEWSSSRPKADGAPGNMGGMSEKLEQFLAEQFETGRVLDAVIAQNEAQARNMWTIRESVAPASRAEGGGLSFDISVATSKVPAFIDKGLKAVLEILPSIRPYPLGHIGDGNIHFSFMSPVGMDRETLRQYSPAITRAVNDLVRDMAGSISAEHGIGIDKIDELAHYRSKVELDTMRSLKRALDPKNIMNPGKILRLSAFVDKLRDIVGEHGLITDEPGKHPYLTDWRENYLGAALAVVRPATTEEVAAVVKLCVAEKVAVVPQGGNTGMMGGGTPHQQGREIVLSLNRMNRIIEIDPIGYTMTVEAGVVLKTIQETAAQHDRLFPLSLAAEGSCSIGGNLSTNAGGVQVLHYGNARQLALGLEVVTPQGEVWNGLRALKKDNTGYDLRDLYLGAEGTLGIITKAILKLWPKPKDVATSWIAVPSPEAAVTLLSGAHAASEDNVTSCELMARQGVDLVLKHIPGAADPLSERHEWYVLLEWSSTRPRRAGANETGLLEKMEAYLGEAMEQGLVLDAALAQNEAQAKAFWGLRENHSESQKREGPSIKHDISVSVSKIPAFMTQGLAAMKKALPECRPVPFGHVGDGNIHFNCQAPVGWDKDRFMAHAHAISSAVYDIVVAHGGSISAEHGIGQMKVAELAHYRSRVELDTMRAIKRALDPQNLMNPGKILDLSA